MSNASDQTSSPNRRARALSILAFLLVVAGFFVLVRDLVERRELSVEESRVDRASIVLSQARNRGDGDVVESARESMHSAQWEYAHRAEELDRRRVVGIALFVVGAGIALAVRRMRRPA